MIATHKRLTEVLVMMFDDTFSPGKVNFACCQCRLALRQDARNRHHVDCPRCARPMHNMGVGFVAPQVADNQQWRKIEMLVAHDFSFEILSA